MKRLILLATALISLNGHTGPIELADVGFANFGHYIAIELTTKASQPAYNFTIRDVKTNAVTRISSCTYVEAQLINAVAEIKDPAVRKDFDWIFMRSGRATTSFETFYPEFKALLESVDPNCELPGLKTFPMHIESKAG